MKCVLGGLRFEEDKVDGEWVLCFTKNSQGSPSLQKVTGTNSERYYFFRAGGSVLCDGIYVSPECGLVGNHVHLLNKWCGSREFDSCGNHNLCSFFRNGKRENASK